MPRELEREKANFVFPTEVLLRQKKVGERVVVAGGGFVGCETALYLAEALKKKVTVISRRDEILSDLNEPMSTMSIHTRLPQAGVEVHTSLTLRSYSGKKVICTDKVGKEHEMDADSVVLAWALQPRHDAVAQLEGLTSQVFKIGDCVQPRKIYHAFREAWNVIFSF
jgi:2-enoate reductase